MAEVFLATATFLLLNVAAGLFRVARGPTPVDRMLAAQLFGTTGVAVLLLLAEATGRASLRDVALVFALLAVVVGAAFVKRGWTAETDAVAAEADRGGGDGADDADARAEDGVRG